MALVITEPCIDCQDQSCVAVCPVDCIHPGVIEYEGKSYNQFFIQTEACICCSLCDPECPVDAIYPDDELPADWSHYADINAAFYRTPKPEIDNTEGQEKLSPVPN